MGSENGHPTYSADEAASFVAGHELAEALQEREIIPLSFTPDAEWLIAVIVLLQRVEEHFEGTDAPLGIDTRGLLEKVRRAQCSPRSTGC